MLCLTLAAKEAGAGLGLSWIMLSRVSCSAMGHAWPSSYARPYGKLGHDHELSLKHELGLELCSTLWRVLALSYARPRAELGDGEGRWVFVLGVFLCPSLGCRDRRQEKEREEG
ncbi:hypothetical protein Dimus_028558 [Dionaea muscipula]